MEDHMGAALAAGDGELVALLDSLLADEIQHVRVANVWIRRLVAADSPAATFAVIRATAQANEAARRLAEPPAPARPVATAARLEAGFDLAEVEALARRRVPPLSGDPDGARASRGGVVMKRARMIEAGPTGATLRGPALVAAVSLWRRTGREIATSFAGSSMEPAIPAGVEVQLSCGAEVAVGDIVAVIRRDRLLVHRVVGLSGRAGWILTCGDANPVPDPPITDRAAVVGRIVKVRRGASLVDPSPAPPRCARRPALRLCLWALGRERRLGRPLTVTLWLLYHGLVLVPRSAWRRLRAALA
jgi:hypothetical protein